MDFSNPGIGLGKAGNNPYQWLALGAHGLQSMLADTMTNDPGSMGNSQFLGGDWGGGSQTPQFMRAAEVQGQPVTAIPRQVHGLLPILALKLGLIPQSVSASQDQLNMEQLGLQAVQRQRMSDMLDQFKTLTDFARYAGPKATSDIYRSMPQVPGLTPESIAQWKTPQEETLEARRQAEIDRQNFQARNDDLSRQVREAQIAHLEALTDKADRPDKGADKLMHQRYANAYGLLRQMAQSPTGMSNPNIQKAHEFLIDAENTGQDPDTAWRQAQEILHPPEAPEESGGTMKGVVDWFLGRGGATPTSAAPTASPTTSATVAPKVVKPKFTK